MPWARARRIDWETQPKVNAPPAVELTAVLAKKPLALPQEASWKKYAVELSKLQNKVSTHFKQLHAEKFTQLEQAVLVAANTMREAADKSLEPLVQSFLQAIIELSKKWHMGTKAPRDEPLAIVKAAASNLLQAIPTGQSLGLTFVSPSIAKEYTDSMAKMDSHVKQLEVSLEERLKLIFILY